jgi:hypothetical protein
MVGELELRARCDASISIPVGTEVGVSFRDGSCSLVPADP